MRDHFRNTWQVLRSSLWFIPALITAFAMLLAVVLLQLDRALAVSPPALLFDGGADGAREILSTIAASVITVAGVAFSITIVALSLAASQYGPLLLANYLRDPVNQTALGIFVGTFIYCLIVLNSVYEGADRRFIPAISVTVSLILALLSLATFVVFIHHLAQSMRPDHLAARVGENLLEAIGEMFPAGRESGAALPDPSIARRLEADARPVHASRNGYLQAVEWDSLLQFAQREDLLIRVEVHPGDFIGSGSIVARVLPQGNTDEALVRHEVMDRLLIGRVRTPTQDPEYSVHQLAQVAVRALSPGINDPYTALTCIDWLEAALHLLSQRSIPSEYRFAEDGGLRLIMPQPGFETMANAAFNKIRHAGRADASILMRLAKAAGGLASQAGRDSDREVLRRILFAIRDDARANLATERERAAVEALCADPS